MLSKRYESTEAERRTWLHVSSGTHWSNSSDTHQHTTSTQNDMSSCYELLGFVEFSFTNHDKYDILADLNKSSVNWSLVSMATIGLESKISVSK